MASAAKWAAPGAVWNGAALTRGLEFSAREKGVQFMLNRKMTEIVREQPFSGRVLGIRARYSPRFDPDTKVRLASYSRNGNIDERRDTINIRAKTAIFIGSGGHSANPQLRSMFYPALNEPAFVSSGYALLGPDGGDGSGIVAGMRIGANLAGMQQNLGITQSFHIPPRLATRDTYTDMLPGHPTFPFRRSTGITLGTSSYEHLIAVNQVGKRFFNEMDVAKRYLSPIWPGGPRFGVPTHSLKHVQCDWRNCSPEWVKQMYNGNPALDAAMAMNEGSQAPHFYSGPLWAIFDRGTVERDKWDIKPPFTADNGYFFTADTIEELARKIEKGHEFQRVPLSNLAETVRKWNSYVDAGADPDFGRGKDAPMHKIDKPPFYAAAICPVWHDSYGGLRINGKGQVLDTQGEVIPGLFSGGEASGGGNQHGLGRALVHGYIAGSEIARRGRRDPVVPDAGYSPLISTFSRGEGLVFPSFGRGIEGEGRFGQMKKGPRDDEVEVAPVEPHAAAAHCLGRAIGDRGGRGFKFAVGGKCSDGCDLGGRELSIFDHEGSPACTVKLGHAVWPGTEALYVAEVEVRAPLDPGCHEWEAKLGGWDAEVPHAPGSFPLSVRVVSAPDCEVTVTAIDREKRTPITGACVVMHLTGR